MRYVIIKNKKKFGILEGIFMKKIIAVLACAAALTATAYASPQTDFTKGEWEVEAGMSHSKAKMGSYKSAARWNFDGAVTYG